MFAKPNLAALRFDDSETGGPAGAGVQIRHAYHEKDKSLHYSTDNAFSRYRLG
jgi:hypothetical protein